MLNGSIMPTTPLWKRIGQTLLDIFEIYIPTIAFAVMFLVFILQIYYRYFLNSPLTWPPEVINSMFIWTTILGACYAHRTDSHVSFGIVYDRLSPRGQRFFRIISNLFIGGAFVVLLWPATRYVRFMGFKQSTVLRVPFSVIFAPFIIFLLIFIGRMTHALYLDLRPPWSNSVPDNTRVGFAAGERVGGSDV